MQLCKKEAYPIQNKSAGHVVSHQGIDVISQHFVHLLDRLNVIANTTSSKGGNERH